MKKSTEIDVKLDDQNLLITENDITDLFGIKTLSRSAENCINNFIKATSVGVGRITKPLITVIQAYADSKASTIKLEAQLRAAEEWKKLSIQTAVALQEENLKEGEIQLAQRAMEGNYYAMIKRQNNREKVCGYALNQLRQENLFSLATESHIEDDWLSMFWKTVEDKSDQDIQKIFSRILAGECVKPGSFSARLLHILSVTTSREASFFQAICGMAISDEYGSMLLEPIAEFDNFLEEELFKFIGTDNNVIADLESLGLLSRGLNVAFLPEEEGTVKRIGNKEFVVKIIDKKLLDENGHILTGIPLTLPAEELRNILFIDLNESYLDALLKFLKLHIGIELVPV